MQRILYKPIKGMRKMFVRHCRFVVHELKCKPRFSFLEILEEMLIKRCCLGCNKLNVSSISQKGHNQQIVQQFNISTRSDILLPVYGKSIATFKLPYQPLLTLKHIAIIGKNIKSSPKKYTSRLIMSVVSTWPLLLMALLMAICAGSVIWLLVRMNLYFNFPKQRKRGYKHNQLFNFVFKGYLGKQRSIPKKISKWSL